MAEAVYAAGMTAQQAQNGPQTQGGKGRVKVCGQGTVAGWRGGSGERELV